MQVSLAMPGLLHNGTAHGEPMWGLPGAERPLPSFPCDRDIEFRKSSASEGWCSALDGEVERARDRAVIVGRAHDRPVDPSARDRLILCTVSSRARSLQGSGLDSRAREKSQM